MGSIPPEFPISLRSWPTDTDFKSDLPELIRRINFERGGFREISEESLRQEIAEEEANAGDDSSEEDEEEKPDRTKELFTAREEMIDQIGCVLVYHIILWMLIVFQAGSPTDSVRFRICVSPPVEGPAEYSQSNIISLLA
jgi:hypothetical protein